MKRKKERSLPVRLFSLLVKLAIAAVILVVGINVYITKSTEKDISNLKIEDLKEILNKKK